MPRPTPPPNAGPGPRQWANRPSGPLAERTAEALHFVPDVVVMLRGLLTDPRVPQSAKAEAAAGLGLLASPRRRLVHLVPFVGPVDTVMILALTVRRLLTAAGEPVLREHWRGSDRGLELVLSVTRALATPRGMLRRMALLTAGLSAARDVPVGQKRGGRARSGRLGTAGGQPRGRGRRGRVVEGEVLNRREERFR